MTDPDRRNTPSDITLVETGDKTQRHTTILDRGPTLVGVGYPSIWIS